jgi:hypothetical protein
MFFEGNENAKPHQHVHIDIDRYLGGHFLGEHGHFL